MTTFIHILKKVTVFLFLLNPIICLSQIWPHIYGDNLLAYGKDIMECYDKGYAICGCNLKDASHFKFGWLIKTDINGNELWNKKFGNWTVENSFFDFDKTSDNGFILSGSTAQYDIEIDPLFVKLDPCGEIEWCRIFRTPGFNHSRGVISLPDGGFLGMLSYYGGQYPNVPRISLVKMDSEGNPIWIKHLAQEDSTVFNEEGYNLYLTPDSNYMVAGCCYSPSLKPYYIKTDPDGNEIWDIKWPIGNQGDAYRTVFQDNGTVYSATNLRFTGHPNKPYILKFDLTGDIITQFPLMGDTIVSGGSGALFLDQDSILYTGISWTDDPYLYSGYSDILKTDTNGNLKIQRRLVDNLYAPNTIIKSFDNKILTIGTYYLDGNWDIYLWKMNTNLEDDTLYTQPLTYDSLCPYEIQSDTVDLDCGVYVNIDEIPTKEEYESTIKISPNPAREWVMLTLPDVVASGKVDVMVYNIIGREILSIMVFPSKRSISMNVSAFPPGIYLVQCRDSNNKKYIGKFVCE